MVSGIIKSEAKRYQPKSKVEADTIYPFGRINK